MEPLYFIWLLILSVIVAGQSSTLRALGRSVDQVRAWIDSVVAQSSGATTAPAAAPAVADSAAPAVSAPAVSSPAASSGEEHGGRWLAVVGSLAVVAAAAFAVQYAIEQGWLTEGLRMALGAIIGLSLAFAGNALRPRLAWFADAILGLGLALLYLTVYSGYVFFDFYGYGFALVAAVAVSVLSAALAISSKSEAPAALGVAGAFLTAIVLPMTASPAAVAFAFAVSAVALVAAVGLGWQATQALSLVGGAIVYFEYLGWGYDAETDFWFVEIFGLLFLALFTFAGYGWSALRRREPSRSDIALSVAGSLVFAPVTIALAAGYSTDFDGFLPLFLALAYGAAAVWGYSAGASKIANAASLGLAASFLAVAVALQLDGVWVPILWAAEAILLAVLARATADPVFGVISGALTFFALVGAVDTGVAESATPVLNARFAALASVLVAGWVLAAASRVVSRLPGKENWRGAFAAIAVASHLLALGVSAGEINLAYQPKIEAAYESYYEAQGRYSYDRDGYGEYVGGSPALEQQSYAKARQLESAKTTAVAIVWGLYGALILVVGFAVGSAPSRYAGVATILLAAANVFLIVWDLGTGYRVIASLGVGLLALGGAYLFARHRHQAAGERPSVSA